MTKLPVTVLSGFLGAGEAGHRQIALCRAIVRGTGVVVLAGGNLGAFVADDEHQPASPHLLDQLSDPPLRGGTMSGSAGTVERWRRLLCGGGTASQHSGGGKGEEKSAHR